MEWMHPKTSSQSSLFESTVNETCMVQKCTRALDCPWCGRWKPPGENCDLWMKLAPGMGTQIIWELKQRLKQDSCCLTCSLWTIHLDICFNLFSPVRLPTEGGGFYWHVLKGLRSELLSTALCSLWKAWRITASCCGLCFSFWNGSPTDLMVWFLPPHLLILAAGQDFWLQAEQHVHTWERADEAQTKSWTWIGKVTDGEIRVSIHCKMQKTEWLSNLRHLFKRFVCKIKKKTILHSVIESELRRLHWVCTS